MSEPTTDRDRLVALLESFGLSREREWPFGHQYAVLPARDIDREQVESADTAVILARGHGYAGFHATFLFDAAGKFVGHGVWE